MLNLLIFITIAFSVVHLNPVHSNHVKEDINADAWTGKWFPHPPNHIDAYPIKVTESCDDGKHSIGVDYNPLDKSQSFNYHCMLVNRSEYEPSWDTEAVVTSHYIPKAYSPPVMCLNESITYDYELPTYGAFRPLSPIYGSYRYLPPQRWLRSLAEGAIVMLYHPCANHLQTDELHKLVQGCLYRHVITASPLLTPQRPLALVAWGKSIQMSVVDRSAAIGFIKENARKGFKLLKQVDNSKYKVSLVRESHLVTDENDSELCGYQQM